MDKGEKLCYIAYGLVAYGLGVFMGGVFMGEYSPLVNPIPKTEQVQQGYIAPSRLEIECEDFDKNGESETIMKVDDRSYALREIDGKPVLSVYETRPTDIRYKAE